MDVIPVDLVVGAICAVAARGPANEDGSPDITQVGFRCRQPAALPTADRPRASPGSRRTRCTTTTASRSSVPEWSFPGRGRVQRQLERSRDLLGRVEKVAPVAAAARPPGRVVGQGRGEARDGRAGARLRHAVRRVHRVRGDLRRRPPPRPARRLLSVEDRSEFELDPRVIDWDHYVDHIHLPSVVKQARVRTEAGRGAASPDMTVCDDRSCPPSATSRRSTWRTR